MTVLNFELVVDNRWPPVAVEGIQCIDVKCDYRIVSPPLFVKGLSVGDVIAASPDNEGRVWEWNHVSKSHHSTIWLGRLSGQAQSETDRLLQAMRNLHCGTAGSDQLGCYAVDVPPECAIESIDELLDSVDSSEIAVAFPSFRHGVDGVAMTTSSNNP